MPTVHRAYGLRFVVYVDDHAPAHVHVLGDGGEAKISLGPGRPSVLSAKGFDRAALRKALLEVVARRELLRAAWERVHGPAPEEAGDEA